MENGNSENKKISLKKKDMQIVKVENELKRETWCSCRYKTFRFKKEWQDCNKIQ